MKIKVPQDVVSISRILTNAGYQCYMVGGAVRDQLLGLPAKDYDLCTDATPETVISLFRKVIPTGIKHGTVTILFRQSPYEITTFRIDGEYSDGRRPDKIHYTDDLHEDLIRRDFTINSIAYDIGNQRIIDPNGGRRDLKDKIIRAIGIPEERFNEDGLRSIRACRFASQLNFRVIPETIAGIKHCLHNIPELSRERIYDEFIKIMQSNNPSISFKLFRETGILPLIFPELDKCIGVEQKGSHDYDVYTHLLKSCDSAPYDNIDVRIAALFHDIGKPDVKAFDRDGIATFYHHETVSAKIAEKIMLRYRFPKERMNHILHLIRNHMFHFTPDWTDAAVRRFIRKIGLENLEDQYVLRCADIIGMSESKECNSDNLGQLKERVFKILQEENAFSIKDLSVNGNDLINVLEIPKGPRIGQILEFLLEAVLDDPSHNNREKLLQLAENFNNSLK